MCCICHVLRVRWKEIPSAGDTWEPATNLEDEESQTAIMLFQEKRVIETVEVGILLCIFPCNM